VYKVLSKQQKNEKKLASTVRKHREFSMYISIVSVVMMKTLAVQIAS